MAKPRIPKGLGTSGTKIWREAVDEFVLSNAQLKILEGACRQADLIDELWKQIRELNGNYRVKGSVGQWTEAPELKLVKAAQVEMRTALSSIGLTKPDYDETEAAPTVGSVSRRASFEFE